MEMKEERKKGIKDEREGEKKIKQRRGMEEEK